MRFGVNYTPSVGWFHSWLDFSASDTARDLEAIAALGADHVRVFPLWPVVQPNRTLIRRQALDDVARVVDIAASFGLDVTVDALQGHLSSFDFLPSWLDSWHRRNMFTDPDVVASTAAYVRALAAAVADRPNLLGITIGNEVNQFAHAPHPSPHAITPEQGHAWAAAMVAAARSGLASAGRGLRSGSGRRLASGNGSRPGPLVTVAQYDAAWYDDAQPFGPEHAADHGDATVTHSWVFNGAAAVHGALGAGSVRHGEYLLQLAAAWNHDAARPNWLQEVGAPTNVVPLADAPAFTEQTIRHALDVQHLLGRHVVVLARRLPLARGLPGARVRPRPAHERRPRQADGGAVPGDGAGVRRQRPSDPRPPRPSASCSTTSVPTAPPRRLSVPTAPPAAGSPPPGSRSPSSTASAPRSSCARGSPTRTCSPPAG